MQVTSQCDTVCGLDSITNFYRYGGCYYATGEASFEAEACDQGRNAGVGCGRIDSLADGRRIRIGRADRGRAAEA